LLTVAEVDHGWKDAGEAEALVLERPRPGPAGLPLAGYRPAADPVRRGLNVVVAGAVLALALPLMAAIALLVRLTAGAPVLIGEPRVGLDRRDPLQRTTRRGRRHDHGGRLFTIYRFRTDGVPLGRVLRRYGLDELPLLVNVLKGDMNMVGPRPEPPQTFSRLRAVHGRFPHRQRVLPGITGLAQVSQRRVVSPEDVRARLSYDLAYLRRASAIEDLRILGRTIPVLLFEKGRED
jgi:lipopolysaccharide/colanic/teichoic acid biosynthesis glycosyltransferase